MPSENSAALAFSHHLKRPLPEASFQVHTSLNIFLLRTPSLDHSPPHLSTCPKRIMRLAIVLKTTLDCLPHSGRP